MKQKQAGQTLLYLIVGVSVVGILLWFLYNNNYNPNSTPQTLDETSGENQAPEVLDEEMPEIGKELSISPDEILENPDLYEGMVVTVRGEVEERLSERSFALDALGVVDDNLLVITATSSAAFDDPEVFGDAIWEATGQVEQFNITAVSEMIDMELDPDVFDVYEAKPYIFATVVSQVTE